jgi:hypothetical protein
MEADNSTSVYDRLQQNSMCWQHLRDKQLPLGQYRGYQHNNLVYKVGHLSAEANTVHCI